MAAVHKVPQLSFTLKLLPYSCSSPLLSFSVQSLLFPWRPCEEFQLEGLIAPSLTAPTSTNPKLISIRTEASDREKTNTDTVMNNGGVHNKTKQDKSFENLSVDFFLGPETTKWTEVFVSAISFLLCFSHSHSPGLFIFLPPLFSLPFLPPSCPSEKLAVLARALTARRDRHGPSQGCGNKSHVCGSSETICMSVYENLLFPIEHDDDTCRVWLQCYFHYAAALKLKPV